MARKVISIETGVWKTGAIIPRNGIYSARHTEHRLPSEVTLLQGEPFPRCAACPSAVFFRLRRRLDDTSAALSFHVHLYELPVLDEVTQAS
jgi:hypothetical protein